MYTVHIVFNLYMDDKRIKENKLNQTNSAAMN